MAHGLGVLDRSSIGWGGSGSGAFEGDPPQEITGGGGSGWVALLRAANDIDAHLLVGRLTEAGVETATMKERGRPGAWLHGGSDPWAPVTILVRKLQLDAARLVLAEVAYEAPPTAEGAAVGSRWRAPVVWWVTAIGLGLLFTGLGLAQAAGDIERCKSTASCARSEP